MLFDETFAFVHVVESGSFTAAGRNLGVPKSTLSRQVARLEDELGVSLLTRSTRQLTLTDTGQAYFARCREALSTLSEAVDLARNEGRTPEGNVRVGCSFDAAHHLLAPHLAAFQREYPKISLSFSLSQDRADLVAERIDVTFRGGRLEDSTYICRKIIENEIVLCAAPSYLAEHGMPRSFSELKEHRTLFLGRRGHAKELPFLGPGGIEMAAGEHWLVCNEPSLLSLAVQSGCGIGTLLDIYAGPLIAEGKLRRVLTDYQVGGGGLYAVYPHRHHLSPKVRVFVDFMVERLGPELERARDLARQC